MLNHFFAALADTAPLRTAVMIASGFACIGANEISRRFHREMIAEMDFLPCLAKSAAVGARLPPS